MTVDSGAFADGGLKQPVQLPGGGLLDEEDNGLPEIEKGMAPLWGSPAMIVRLLPPHKKYVEPFAGGGAVFWRKEPSEIEVLGDLDPDVAFSWKFARDCTDEQIAKLQGKNWTATRARFADVRKLEPRDDVERFYKVRMSRWSSFYNEGRAFDTMREGLSYGIAGKLASRRERLKGVKISHASYEKLVKEHDGPETVFFFDPPYPEYKQGVGEENFSGEKFAEVLRSIKGKFLVTYGPKSDLSPFKGFTIRKVTTASVTPRGGVAQKVTVLISNYQLPKVIKKANVVDGMMAALMLPPSAAKQLAAVSLPGTPEPVDNLHVTLAYFGKLSQSEPHDVERIRQALAAATAAHPPVTGKISGFGRFRGGKKDALYASFDAPRLNTLRELITSACDDEGAPYAKEHGFTPHISLAFLDPAEKTPDLKLPDLKLRFDKVTLALGGELQTFPLGGALDADPESLTTKELTAVHKYLHLVHETAEQQQDLPADVHVQHAEVTAELRKRDAAPPPPVNQLDVISKTLEPWDDQGRRFAHVCRSGIELGPPIKREDVMRRLSKPFQIAKPGIYLVGGLAVDGETRGDIDILLRLPPDTSETTKHAIEFRLGRMLGADLARRMHLMLDEYHGPFTDHVPLYNLEFTPCGDRKRKEMRAGDPVPRSLEMPKNVVTSLDELRAFVKEHKGPSSGRMIDVFSGPGALSLGFEKEGFTSVLALEASPYAAATYAMNRPSVPVLFGDCRKFAPDELASILGPAEIVIGGVPCEAFSGARRFAAANTSRGLIRYAMALVSAFKSRLFAFENVTAALKSRSWVAAKNLAERSGYSTSMLQLKAHEHGAATSRKRGLFLGVKGASAPQQDEIPRAAARTFRQAVEGLGKPGNPGLHTGPPELSQLERSSIAKTPPGHQMRYRGDPKKYVPGMMLIVADQPASTLLSSKCPIHPNRKRRLTLREGLRIQGVPDSYRLATETFTPAWDLIGDMVPVPLARAVARALKLRKTEKSLEADATEAPLTKLVSFDAQARESQREDKVEPGRFFYMPKPTRAAMPEQPQSVENLVALYKQRGEKWLPTAAQKKMDGANHQLHKDGEKVLIISEDGGDNTDRFPKLVEAIKSLGPKQLVMAAEIERWDGAQHLPREAVAGYLSSKDPADDEAAGIVANVYDLLHDGEDIHKLPTEERLSRLADIGLPQTTERRPDLKHRLNLVPHHRAETVEQLERTTRSLRQLPGSEGAVFKRTSAPYRLDMTTRDDWVKFHNATTIRGIVTGADSTNGSWTYTFGVLPGKSPSKTSDVEDRELVIVGETFVTSRDFDRGDEILVEAETVNLEQGPQFTALTAWVPRVLGTYTGEPDTVDQAAARARKNLVLQVKKIGDKGEVTYVPMSQVRKAKTTAALLVEAGPPNEWSGGVAGILGKEMRAKIIRLWRALSPEDRKRTLAAFNKMFEAANQIFELENRYGQIAKQRDPYLDVPPETGAYRYVVQLHFRGKSVHGDLRFQTGAKQLIGWTLDVQIADAQKTEVTTLPEARAAVSGAKMGLLSKIDFRSGDWAERPRRGSEKPVRTLVKAQRKSLQPAAWLNVEGITEKPDPGEAPTAGATRRFPGVFLIADNGTVEYGAQKATTHEYFFSGKALNYRVIFRLLRLERRLQKRLEPCMCTVCKAEPAVFDGLPADCSAPPAAICDGCVDVWATGQKGTVISKQQQLPPSKPPEKAPFAEETWFAIRPDDPRPNVLQPDEVAKGWMPPLGISALPKAVRAQVPKELRYWEARTAEKAKDLRDSLVAAIKETDLDFEAPYKRVAKAAPRFVLQQQIWRGPVQVRLGPSKEVWWVRVDTGKGEAIEIELRRSPVDNAEVSAAVGKASVGTLDARGDVPPGTALNPSKDTPSYIELLDKGAATMTERTEDRIVLELSGSKLDGVFELQRRDEGTWIWRRGKDTRKFIPVIKVDKKEGIVTGIVMEPDEVDGQNERASAEVIRRACYSFMARFRLPGGTQLGDMHNKFGQVGFDLIENWIERSDTAIGRQKVKAGTWLQSWRKTPDSLGDEAFRRFETGERTGFSIGGFAKVI